MAAAAGFSNSLKHRTSNLFHWKYTVYSRRIVTLNLLNTLAFTDVNISIKKLLSIPLYIY